MDFNMGIGELVNAEPNGMSLLVEFDEERWGTVKRLIGIDQNFGVVVRWNRRWHLDAWAGKQRMPYDTEQVAPEFIEFWDDVRERGYGLLDIPIGLTLLEKHGLPRNPRKAPQPVIGNQLVDPVAHTAWFYNTWLNKTDGFSTSFTGNESSEVQESSWKIYRVVDKTERSFSWTNYSSAELLGFFFVLGHNEIAVVFPHVDFLDHEDFDSDPNDIRDAAHYEQLKAILETGKGQIERMKDLIPQYFSGSFTVSTEPIKICPQDENFSFESSCELALSLARQVVSPGADWFITKVSKSGGSH